MTAPLSEQAPAKINLTLRVVGRRGDGYHALESLVAFADLADTLTLAPGAQTTLAITGPFAAACGPAGENLVLKAVNSLAARVDGLRAGGFKLEKRIPVAGGIGGGSADAAAALRVLARLNNLARSDARLAAAAKSVGADVPVCLDPRARIMRGIGEELSAPITLPRCAALLVNPGVPLATRDVFTTFRGQPSAQDELGAVPAERETLFAVLARHGNDLTDAAIARVPVIADVLDALRSMSGARLARMSGSGPTCFALFDSAAEADAAAAKLKATHPHWWLHSGSIG